MLPREKINQRHLTSRRFQALSNSVVEETQEVGVIENLPRVFSKYCTQLVYDS